MKTYELNCEVFIVPNSMCYLEHLCVPSFRERVNEICQYNGVDTTYDTPLFQAWFVGGDSDNMGDHGFRVGERTFGAGFLKAYLPAELFFHKNEGDVVTVHYPVDEDTDLTLNCRLAQTKYRYSNYGTFEECFRKLYHALRFGN